MNILTFLLAIFVYFTLHLQSVELRSSRSSRSSGTSESSVTSGRLESKPTQKRCLDSCQCPNGTACLPVEFGKRRKTCQTCGCRLSEQCRINATNDVICDCSDSGYTGINCEAPIEPPADPLCEECPSGWSQYNSHCYRHYDNEVVNWTTASERCKSVCKNSHLTEITSKGENDFLLSLMGKYSLTVWIGLNDIEEENTFRWSYSGNELAGFNAKASDWVNENDDCSLLYTAKWYDFPCSDKTQYICEISFLN